MLQALFICGSISAAAYAETTPEEEHRNYHIKSFIALLAPEIKVPNLQGLVDYSSADPVTLPADKALVFIVELVAKQRGYEAERMLLQIIPSLKTADKSLRIQAKFLLATIYAGKEKYDDAIKLYEDILIEDPKAARVRLDLALALFRNKSYYRSNYHFRLAISDPSIPDEVRKNAQQFLYQIRRDRIWNAWASFSLASDSNLNQSPGSSIECIQTVYGPLCRQREAKKSGTGFNYEFGGNYDLKLTDNFRWRNLADIIMVEYHGSVFDRRIMRFESGPRYIFHHGDIFLGATYLKTFLSHKGYLDAPGAKLDVNYDFSSVITLFNSISYQKNNYASAYSDYSGSTRSIYPTLYYSFLGKNYLAFKTGFEQNKTKATIQSNNSYTIGAGIGTVLPYGFGVYAEEALIKVNFNKKSWFLNSEGSFEELKRRENYYRTYLSFYNSTIRYKGFTPTLSYIYTKKISNVWHYSYDEQTFQLGVTQKF